MKKVIFLTLLSVFHTVLHGMNLIPAEVLWKYKKEHNVPDDQARRYAQELMRYFILVQKSSSSTSLVMASPQVDNLWHTFLLYTREYADFCCENFGRFIHHCPLKSHESPSPEEVTRCQQEFVACYKQCFQEEPSRDIWSQLYSTGKDLWGSRAGCGGKLYDFYPRLNPNQHTPVEVFNECVRICKTGDFSFTGAPSKKKYDLDQWKSKENSCIRECIQNYEGQSSEK